MGVTLTCVMNYYQKAKILLLINIKTHGSESQGQEEAGCIQQKSELFTHSTTLKL